LNIQLEEPDIITEIAEAGRGEREGFETPEEAARAMDRLRERIGPTGVSTRDLIEEGRYR